MTDGERTLKFDDDTVRRLKAAADAAGRPMDAYPAEIISATSPSEARQRPTETCVRSS